ncbi:MAG: HAMP domain-containing protein [Acidobacteria bacterium]|nr:HAMP domain-containing protein [Acidobacteriota bacterium]
MLNYRNLQIQHKLIASFAVILVVVLVLAVSNYVANSRIGSLSNSLEEHAYMAYKDGASLVESFTNLSEALTEAIGFSDSSKLEKAEEIATDFESTLQHLKTVAPDDAAEIDKIESDYKKYFATGKEIVTALVDFNNADSINSQLSEFGTAGNELRGELVGFTQSKDSIFQKGIKEVTHTANFYANFTIWISLGTMLLAAFLAINLGRSIGKPIREIARVAEKVAVGDLTVQIETTKRGDEVGVLNRSFHSLIGYIRDLSSAIEGLSKNDLSVNIEPKSPQDQLSLNIQRTIQTLRDLAEETKNMTRFAMDGNLSQRGDASKFQGVYADVVNGMNMTFEAVVGPFNETAAVLERLADHDLTARVTGNYKGDFERIKQAMNTASNNLEQALSEVSTASQEITTVSGQISGSSQSLSGSATAQASSLEEVSSSLQEMSSMTKQNASNAKEARSLSDGARSTAGKGMDSMNRLSEAINRIKTSSDSTAKIVKTIDEIAFQTNLLALNAAVEAARAGDAGKGFAVVAEEVRNLAMRSAEAAKNTSNLIEESVKNAEGGVEINQEVLVNLEEINTQVNKVSEVMAEIASASDQQSQGIDQITTSVQQMSDMTQQNAANSEESAASAVELDNLAHKMQKLVDAFEIGMQSNAQADSIPTTSRESSAGKPKISTGSHTAKSSTGKSKGSGARAEELIPFDADYDILREF